MSESVGKVLWREEGEAHRGVAVLVTAEPLDRPLVCLERTPEDSDDGENDGCGYLSLYPSEARSLAAALVAWADRVEPSPTQDSAMPPVGRIKGLLRLEVSAPLGGTIYDATELAVAVAQKLGVYVAFRFNGQDVTCYPTCDPVKVASDVMKRMSGRPA